jgi:hypothetical protein
MNLNEFVYASEMYIEDKEKTISIYGDPQTWVLENDHLIGDCENAYSKDDSQLFLGKFKNYKELNQNLPLTKFLKILDEKEVSVVIIWDDYYRAFYQLKDDESSKDFYRPKEIIDKNIFDISEYCLVGKFNHLQSIYSDIIPLRFSIYVFNTDSLKKGIDEVFDDEDEVDFDREQIKDLTIEDFLDTYWFDFYSCIPDKTGYYPDYSWASFVEASTGETTIKIFYGD